ncbi:MAG: hypothetical protein VSS75_033385 [Candidatus Parabeggiatoa sp.]|nr:hypothetical protein [Candidatus Parabeggiatoa sp.]
MTKARLGNKHGLFFMAIKPKAIILDIGLPNCIDAGANDYLSKPVDTDKLISLMRVWLYR